MANHGIRDIFTTDETVILNDLHLKVEGDIRYDMVNIYGRKVNQGDPGPDDHPINSTLIGRNWTAGGQINTKSNPASDLGRFWWAQSSTEHPGVITLPPLTYVYKPPAGVTGIPIVLGDFQDRLWVAWGAHLCYYNKGTESFIKAQTLSHVPINEAVVYRLWTGVNKGQKRMFIPMGSTYQVFDGTNAPVAGVVDVSAIDFAIWDNKLFRVGSNGHVQYMTDGATWVDMGTNGAYIPDDSTPRHIESYFDKRQESTLHVISDAAVYVLEFDQGILHTSEMEFPRHPHQGRAAKKWRSELYVSVGTGTMRYNGQIVAPMGLDRDEGLPQEFAGFIVDLEPEYNAMYCLVQGQGTGAAHTDTVRLQLGGADSYYFAQQQTYSLLMKWNSFGWHYCWHGSGVTPTTVKVSQADGIYAVWFAAGGTIQRQDLTTTYFNPKQITTVKYAEEGMFEMFWHEWGWLGQPKVLKSFELFTSGCSPTEVIEVYYKLDRDENNWALLDAITTNGEHRYDVGVDPQNPTLPDGRVRALGEEHQRFKLMFRFRRAAGIENAAKHPVIEWYTGIGRKWLRPQRTWRFTATLLESNKPFMGEDNRSSAERIEAMVNLKHGVEFVHQERIYIVDVVAVTGPEKPGLSFDAYRSINLIESQPSV